MTVAGWGQDTSFSNTKCISRLFLWSETGHCVPGRFPQFSARIAPNDAPGSEAAQGKSLSRDTSPILQKKTPKLHYLFQKITNLKKKTGGRADTMQLKKYLQENDNAKIMQGKCEKGATRKIK